MKKRFESSYVNGIIRTAFFVFFAAAPFFWHINNSHYSLMGNADFISPITSPLYMYGRLFVYEPFMFAGINYEFLIAQFMPLLIFYSFFTLLNFSPGFITSLYLFTLLIIAEMSMYKYLKYFIKDRLKWKIDTVEAISLFGGIVYALSPYVITLIAPGHIFQLSIYATLPIILLFFDKILVEKRIDLKKFLLLFFIFLFNASAFANVGLIYVLLIILALYFLPFLIIQRNFILNVSKFLLTSVLIVLSNLWWLITFIVGLKEAVIVNQASTTLNNSLGIAIKNASVLNLFLGRGESMLYYKEGGLPSDFYLSIPLLLIFVGLLLFSIYCLLNIKQKSILIPIVILFIVGIFIAKGFNEPFGNLFLFFYDNLPGFQIFRRPVSKFYWVFLFALIVLACIGIAYLLLTKKNKKTKLITISLMVVSSIYLWIIFALTPLLTPFSIPKHYMEARDYLTKDNINKIVIFPDFYGTYPTYDKTFNYYYGSDFLQYIWKFSWLVPDRTAYSPNLLYKKDLNKMAFAIREKKSFCEYTKRLGITHIMVRQDIDLKGSMEDKPVDILTRLSNSREIYSNKHFGTASSGFTIFKVKPNCSQTDSIILNNKKVQYTMVNPVKYTVRIVNIKNNDTLQLLNNFNPSWAIYAGKREDSYTNQNYYQVNSFFSDIQDIAFLWKNSISDNRHFISQNYANGWKLDLKELEKIGALEKKKDGTFDAHVIIYYRLQLYLYIGLFIFSLIILSIGFYLLYNLIKRKNI